jgi:hypothetical protein
MAQIARFENRVVTRGDRAIRKMMKMTSVLFSV